MGQQVGLEVVCVRARHVVVLVDLHGHQHRRPAQIQRFAADEAQVLRRAVQRGHLRVRVDRSRRKVLADHLLAVDVSHHALATVDAQLKAVVALPHRRHGHRQGVVTSVGAHRREAARNVRRPGGIHRVVPVDCGLRTVGVPPRVLRRNHIRRVELHLRTTASLQTSTKDVNSVHLDVEVRSIAPARSRSTIASKREQYVSVKRKV